MKYMFQSRNDSKVPLGYFLGIIIFLIPIITRGQSISFDKIDRYLNVYLESNDLNGVLLIANESQALFEKSYSNVKLSPQYRINEQSKFAVASISKTFTAAGIIYLSQQGKLNLDDHISKYTDVLNEDPTIEQLLLHQSGIPYLKDIPGMNGNLELIIQQFKGKDFQFKPGADNRYSNEGYMILAYVIQKITGVAYNKFLKDTFFQPLDMFYTGTLPYDNPIDLTDGMRVTGQGLKPANKPYYDYKIGSGSVYSTGRDLLKWAKSLRSSQIIDFDGLTYPYGWGKRNYFDHRVIEQSGLVNGYVSYLAMYPDDHLYIVFLSNISSGIFGRIPHDIPAMIFGEPIYPPPSYSNKKYDLSDYPGNYQTEDGLKFRIGKDNDGLVIFWPNRPDGVVLSPSRHDSFINREDFSENVFERNQDGIIKGFTIKIQTFTLYCKKLDNGQNEKV